MAQRTDPEKHRAQVRAANKSRYRATQRLIRKHQAEWDELYEEEALIEGVTPKPRERIDAVVVQSEVSDYEARISHALRGAV